MHQISSQLGSSDGQPQVVAPSQLGAEGATNAQEHWQGSSCERTSSEGGRGRFGGARVAGRAGSSAGDLAPSCDESPALPLLGCRLCQLPDLPKWAAGDARKCSG